MKNFFARGKDKLCGTTGDLVMLAFVRIVTTALGLLVTKLMAVHFSLQQYGTYSQAMLLQSTATSITILGLTDAVSYFYNKAATRKEKQRYLSTIFTLQYVMGSGCAVLLLVFQIPLIRYFDNESLRSVLLYVAWMPLVNNLLPMLQVLYVSIGRTKQIAVRNLLVSLIQLLADSRSGICFFSPAISTSCRNSLPAEHPGCRREPPEDWRPLRLFVLHPASRPGFRSGVPEPSQPYQLHRLQSFYGRQ